MPCNWSTTTSFLLRGIDIATFCGNRANILSVKLRSTSCNPLARGTPRARNIASTALAPNVDNIPQSLSQKLVLTTARLTAAQVSRAAAQAVRLCIREGGFGDALYVVNSACHSVLGGPLQPQAAQSSTKLEPLSFGRPVSPRLCAHAFLHGLVRRGYPKKAATYAKLMVQVGIPIRPRTLESIVSSMVSPLSASCKLGPFARAIPRKAIRENPGILQLQTHMVSDHCTRAALELLQEARAFGQKRTERMYRVLLDTLLMQGEIIVASLLFVLLLKDWELRKAQEAALQDPCKEGWMSYDKMGIAVPSSDALLSSPYPDLRAMSGIIGSIDKAFARLPHDDPVLYPYLQSLAIFAMLLDTGQLHTHRVAYVISALYNCPKTDARVWILQGGQPTMVKAYPYFHDVLKRLIGSLSKDSSRPAPLLARRAYNSLLSYALRHQFSPKMASQVLQHMCVERPNPIPPDIVTYNILLRSGTLLRQMHISETALAAIRAGFKESGVGSSPLDAVGADAQGDEPSELVTVVQGDEPSDSMAARERDACPGELLPSDFPAALARLKSESLELPRAVASPGFTLKLKTHTITSLVKYYTSGGRPDIIVNVLFEMLPELHMIDHPATNGASSQRMPRMSRRDALKRAVAHGPYVYAVFIHALSKAGEVGLAERVFILAQQAQHASHIPGFVESGSPWSLSLHAYTSMMQCYAAVACGRLPKDKLSRYHVEAALLQRDSGWIPKARHHRRGYAAYVHQMSMSRVRTRYTKRQTSRRNGMLLYRSMVSGGRALLKALILAPNVNGMQRTVKDVRPGTLCWTPKPDARFFKAALDLFVGRVHAQHKWKLRWTPMLHKLAAAMVSNGFDIPPRFHPLLAGKWTGQMTTKKMRRAIVCRSYAFPRLTRSAQRWHELTTVKTRGLPVRKNGTWKGRLRTSGQNVGL